MERYEILARWWDKILKSVSQAEIEGRVLIGHRDGLTLKVKLDGKTALIIGRYEAKTFNLFANEALEKIIVKEGVMFLERVKSLSKAKTNVSKDIIFQ